ncbi:hypothetical protein FY528_06620 [Hymenobacter lutimineralis]|uniref:Uncharacterized protein n=1 Tax=Hymenobacter lutimineralis TaxID=2606448 RepID=A0A5D6V8T2_9BACT|nr:MULTISPECIES: hypothetical protein [Hymenobacter]QIX61622.1 hypothetical protein HER32_10710 [Hymenobacter sp. BT18]TYZ11368.1 hypothetical protein FY528_06620 [Hymenobacter lutimineralis]
MKIPAIKQLVETQTLPDLVAAEEAILEEQAPAFEVPGEDEGEQLTHVLAAIFILNHMQDHQMEFKEALREYTKKVRVSLN